MDYDPTCRGVLRAMKVCNGNYGPTNWNGVNQVLLKDEYIVSSSEFENLFYVCWVGCSHCEQTSLHMLTFLRPAFSCQDE
jgi:hypothetical protein